MSLLIHPGFSRIMNADIEPRTKAIATTPRS